MDMTTRVTQAVILVGGFGTRLLPLTKTRPKPAMPVLDKPFIMYLMESLVNAGVTDIILACGYKSEMISGCIAECGDIGATIRYVDEDTPLGTAGAIKNVEDMLDEVFVSANGDTLNFVDVSSQIRTHLEKGADVTLSLSPVDDPSSSGVALMEDDGRITMFQEKPRKEEAVSNMVNTGLYVMNRSILEYVPEETFFDISKDLFPLLLKNDAKVYGHNASGTWIDIGKPSDLIRMNRIMSNTVDRKDLQCGSTIDCKIEGDFYIGKGSVMERCVSRDSIISSSCVLESSELENTMVLKGCTVKGARIINSVIGEGCTVSEGVTVKDAAIGDGAKVDFDVYGAR